MTTLTATKTIMTPDGDNNCNIAPADRRNIYYFSGPTSGTFTLVVDTTNCQFGDQLLIFLQRSDSTLQMNFPDDKFVLTSCGGVATDVTLSGGGEESDHWVQDFYFDGEKFINTLDLG